MSQFIYIDTIIKAVYEIITHPYHCIKYGMLEDLNLHPSSF